MDSSTAEKPSMTSPSVAIFSPGRTTKRSPIARSVMGMRVSLPSTGEDARDRGETGTRRLAVVEVQSRDDGREDGGKGRGGRPSRQALGMRRLCLAGSVSWGGTVKRLCLVF